MSYPADAISKVSDQIRSHSIQLIINSQYICLNDDPPGLNFDPLSLRLTKKKMKFVGFFMTPKTNKKHTQTAKKSLHIENTVLFFTTFYTILRDISTRSTSVLPSIYHIPYIVFSLWYWLACKRIEKKLMWNWTKPKVSTYMQTRGGNAKGKCKKGNGKWEIAMRWERWAAAS